MHLAAITQNGTTSFEIETGSGVANPRVARSSQPWAGGRNLFGIGNACQEQGRAKRRRRFGWCEGGLKEKRRHRFAFPAPDTHLFLRIPQWESQRDSATKPRVARNELPWVSVPTVHLNSEGVAPICNAITRCSRPRPPQTAQPHSRLKLILPPLIPG